MRIKRVVLPVTAVVTAAILAALALLMASDKEAWAQPALPAPTNVRVFNGDNPGEVVVSWEAVADASGYTIGWLDNDAAWDSHYADQDWRNLIRSLDVEGGETTTRTLTVDTPTTGRANYHFRVGSRSSPDAKPATWSAWQPLDVRIDASPDVLALTAALRISRHASELVALSGPTRFGMTPADLSKSAAAVADHKAALEAQLEILSEKRFAGSPIRSPRLVDDGNQLEVHPTARAPLLRLDPLRGYGQQQLTRTTPPNAASRC